MSETLPAAADTAGMVVTGAGGLLQPLTAMVATKVVAKRRYPARFCIGVFPKMEPSLNGPIHTIAVF
jgi:hypothetical protein